MRTGIIGGHPAYYFLRWLGPAADDGAHGRGHAYRDRSKLETLFGPTIWSALAGRSVIDFGCGIGGEAVEAARHGARSVVGIDIRRAILATATAAARAAGVA